MLNLGNILKVKVSTAEELDARDLAQFLVEDALGASELTMQKFELHKVITDAEKIRQVAFKAKLKLRPQHTEDDNHAGGVASHLLLPLQQQDEGDGTSEIDPDSPRSSRGYRDTSDVSAVGRACVLSFWYRLQGNGFITGLVIWLKFGPALELQE